MNREQMSRYFCDFYDSVFSEKVNYDLDKIRTEAKKISGIGDVKAEQIVEIVKNCIGNKDI